MIWVRLVGGLNNGEVKKVDDDQVEIVLRKNTPAPATRAMNRTFGIGDAVVDVKTTRYTRRIVRTHEGEVVYFASDDLGDLEALKHALGP